MSDLCAFMNHKPAALEFRIAVMLVSHDVDLIGCCLPCMERTTTDDVVLVSLDFLLTSQNLPYPKIKKYMSSDLTYYCLAIVDLHMFLLLWSTLCTNSN